MKYTQALADEYIKLWNGLEITPNRKAEAINVAKKILSNKIRYQNIEQLTGVPWHFIALVHYRESSLNFGKNLANGQPLSQKTTIVPKGRGPYSTFEESAVDSLVNVQKYTKDRDWSQPMYFFTIEGYNGYGYHSKGVPSPYLVGGSNKQKAGKYVSDGVYSSSTWDTQLGVLTILKALMELDSTVTFKGYEPKVWKPGERVIRKGDIGDDVKYLQTKLSLDADGIFGPNTDKRVKEFQEEEKLVTDGIVGPATWSALEKEGTWTPEEDEPEEPANHKTYVYCMYGLGGRIWSAGIEDVLASTIRQTVPNVVCPPTRGYTQWKEIVDAIKKQPKGSKTVVIGHSMGASSATYVASAVPVDLVVLYDLAGQVPSRIDSNSGRVIDIYDTALDLVPEWRVQATAGNENRIVRWTSQYGHTGQDDSLDLARKIIVEINKLTV